MRNIDLFLPLSMAVEEVYREHGFEDADFEVVPNMLDSDFDVPDSSVQSDSVRLLYVGHLRNTKGCGTSWTRWRCSPKFELTVVGGGPEHQP